MSSIVKAIVWLALGGAGLVGVGCGGGSDSPADKCNDFVDSFCDRAVDCLVGASGMHDSCVSAFNQVLSCSSVKEVSAAYDRCLGQIESLSCAALFPADPDTGDQISALPTDCSNILLVQGIPGSQPGASRAAAVRATQLTRSR